MGSLKEYPILFFKFEDYVLWKGFASKNWKALKYVKIVIRVERWRFLHPSQHCIIIVIFRRVCSSFFVYWGSHSNKLKHPIQKQRSERQNRRDNKHFALSNTSISSCCVLSVVGNWPKGKRGKKLGADWTIPRDPVRSDSLQKIKHFKNLATLVEDWIQSFFSALRICLFVIWNSSFRDNNWREMAVRFFSVTQWTNNNNNIIPYSSRSPIEKYLLPRTPNLFPIFTFLWAIIKSDFCEICYHEEKELKLVYCPTK